MPFVLLLIAAVFLVSAFNNTQKALATALEQDVPGYMKWAAALGAVGALQWVPGMRTIAKYLLALVLLVIFLRNYQQILAGFTNLSKGAAPLASNPSPAALYASSGGGAVPASSINPASPSSSSGTSSGSGWFNPFNYLIPGQGIGTWLGNQILGQSSVAVPSSPGTATGYAVASNGALVPVESTGNVNANASGTTTISTPFGSFDPALFGAAGTTLDSMGFGGVA